MPENYQVKVRPEKVAVVERIKSELGSTQAVVLTEYRGLTVGALGELRERLRAAGATYRVEKNTLARRACAELGLEALGEHLTGPTAVAYVRGDPVAAAKVLAAFARDYPELQIKAGVLDGRVLGAEETKSLAALDPLEVSRAKIAGLLLAPLQRIVAVAQAPAQRILYVLKELGQQGGRGG